ncbi:MAG: DUF1566 domain-containing protein, partial [Gammaproteobacteria bacterium]
MAVLISGLISGPLQAGAGNRSESILIDGLEWALATNGKNITWPQAVAYCSELTLAGHGDWRLPTMDELKSLHEPGATGGEGIRSPFSIEDCCLWSGESLVDRPAEDGDEIGGSP